MVNEKIIGTLIDVLNLKPHPEGGYYKEIYRSQEQIGVSIEKFGNSTRYSGTSIYYLLPFGHFSAWHRIKSDEIWNYHEGSLLNILSINSQGILSQHKLGNKLYKPDAEYQVIIPAGHWFCAYIDEPDSYVLAGCFVAPGFEFMDFELADREELSQQFRQHQKLIYRFTRA